MLRRRASRWFALSILTGTVVVAGQSGASAWSACKPAISALGLDANWASLAVIHDPPSGACKRPSDLIEARVQSTLRAGGVVFLGEVHDNASHHALRALLLRMVEQNHTITPAYVFEHIRADQTAALDPPPATTEALFAALKWDESGWPDKAMFEPLFKQALGRPIYAGEPERGMVREVARQGLKAFPAHELPNLKLDVPLPGPHQDALLTELEASHCGLMPKAAFANMAIAQRWRDLVLADVAMTAAARHGGAVVLAGNGHVRRDRGAPFALKQLGFDKPVLVVMFTESVPDRVDPAIADLIVSTKPAVRKDPCDEMRARFGKKG